MPTMLVNVIQFAGLVVGVPTALPHGLNLNGTSLTPDLVLAGSAGYGVTVTDTTVTVTRPVTGAATVNVLVWRLHSLVRDFGVNTSLPGGAFDVQSAQGSAAGGGWVDSGTIVELQNTADTVAIGASAMSGGEKVRIVGDLRVEGKATITGSLDPTDLVLSGGTAQFIQWGSGATAPVSAASTGRIRYNPGTNVFESSLNGGAYAPFGGGDVVGPASSTDNALTRFDGTTGKLIQNSIWTLADDGAMTATPTTVAGNGLTLNVNSITNGNGILIDSNSVTSGTMLQVLHQSPDAIQLRSAVRVDQVSPLAAQTIGLYVGQAAPFVGLWLDQTGNGNAIRIPTAANTTENVIHVTADALTTGGMLTLQSAALSAASRSLLRVANQSPTATGTYAARFEQGAPSPAISIEPSADAEAISITTNVLTVTKHVIDVQADLLSTGSILRAYSDSSNTSARSLVNIINDNAAATSATCLRVQQDADANAISVTSAATTDHSVLVIGNAQTTGSVLRVEGTSTDTGSRFTANIRQGSAAATGATALRVEQLSTATALDVNQGANGPGIVLTASSITNNTGLFVIANGLTTGTAARFYSDSADASSRSLVLIQNDNAAATGTAALRVQQDAANAATISLASAGSPASSTSSGFFSDQQIRFKQNVGDEANAGTVVYTASTLQIVGQGTTGTNRVVQLYDTLQMTEVAAVPGGAPAAGFGKLWVRNDAPNMLLFTNDAGNDIVLEDSRTLGSEIDTGQTWTAGQRIYRRAFGYTNIAAGGATAVAVMGFTPTAIVSMTGFHSEGGFLFAFPAYSANTAGFSVSCYMNGGNVTVEVGGGRSSTNSGVVVVEYTKV